MNNQIYCINKTFCSSKHIKFLDKYKFNVDYDKKYFGEPDIFFCEDCKISFAKSMPSENKILEYYRFIYRSKNRPHDINDKYSIEILKSRLEFLERNNQLANVKNVLEIGPGNGEFGKLLKDKYNHNIFSIEPDENAKEVLKKHGYKIFETNFIDNLKFDLVLSFHSLEHFNSIESFFDIFKENLNTNSIICVEVPNNNKDQWFKSRPYDSPHLIFFSKNGLEKIFKDRNFDVICSDYYGEEIENVFKNMEISKENFGDWFPEKKYLLKDLKRLIKKFLPENILKLKRNIFNKKKINFPQKLAPIKENSCNLRIIAKTKN